MRKIVSIVLVLFTMLSCRKEVQKSAEKQAEEKKDTSFLKTSRFNFTNLNPQLKNQLSKVSEFEFIEKQIDTINNKTFVNLDTSLLELSEELNDLVKALPIELKNNGVLSRINQLDTYVLLLEDNLKNKKTDSLLLERQLSNILTAYNSLIVQFNETKNSISPNFKKELEKAKFDRDSLDQNEVAPLF